MERDAGGSTMKSILEKIEGVQKLWSIAVAGVPLPSDDKILHWLATYSQTEVEHAMMRVASKLHKGGLVKTTPECEKYISGVMRHQADQTRAKLARMIERQANGRVA
jgi:hypothetical protein